MYGVYFFIVEQPYIDGNILSFDRGWGNGYVLLPPEHPWNGKDYDSIYCNVHGGLTYTEKFLSSHFKTWIGSREIKVGDDVDLFSLNLTGYYIIGFDTCHYNDNSIIFNKNAVFIETEKLYNQCISDNIENSVGWIKKWTKKNRKEKIKKLNE